MPRRSSSAYANWDSPTPVGMTRRHRPSSDACCRFHYYRLTCIAFLPIALRCSGVLYYIYNIIYISYNVPFNFILIQFAFNRRWSCIFHPGNLVLCFPVPSFPPLRFCPTFSSPAFSTPVFFMVPRFPVPRFQRPSIYIAYGLSHDLPPSQLRSFDCDTTNMHWIYTVIRPKAESICGS